METKDQFKKILDWMKQINQAFDSLSEAIQATLKAVRGVRVEQFNDRSRFARDIQKIKQEIRSLMH